MTAERDLYSLQLDRYCAAFWGTQTAEHFWDKGRPLPHACRILEYAATESRPYWVYATCGMTPLSEHRALELFLLSPVQSHLHVELLTAIVHYHQTEATLNLGHTVNFGRPWLDQSECSFGLISLPYLFGPKLEHANIAGRPTRLLWLLPITAEEKRFKVQAGVDALEQAFESHYFNYLDPLRKPVVL